MADFQPFIQDIWQIVIKRQLILLGSVIKKTIYEDCFFDIDVQANSHESQFNNPPFALGIKKEASQNGKPSLLLCNFLLFLPTENHGVSFLCFGRNLLYGDFNRLGSLDHRVRVRGISHTDVRGNDQCHDRGKLDEDVHGGS